jgi:hypothetical protein
VLQPGTPGTPWACESCGTVMPGNVTALDHARTCVGGMRRCAVCFVSFPQPNLPTPSLSVPAARAPQRGPHR